MIGQVFVAVMMVVFAFFTVYLFYGLITEMQYYKKKKVREAEREKYWEDKEWVCHKHGAIKTGWTPAYYKTKEGKILFCPLCWLELMDRECERLTLRTVKKESEF